MKRYRKIPPISDDIILALMEVFALKLNEGIKVIYHERIYRSEFE